MTVGDKKVDISSDEKAKEVLFDTGSSFNYLPKNVFEELVQQLKQYENPQIPEVYPCDPASIERYPNVTLSVAGMDLILDPYSYFYFNQTVNNDISNL